MVGRSPGWTICVSDAVGSEGGRVNGIYHARLNSQKSLAHHIIMDQETCLKYTLHAVSEPPPVPVITLAVPSVDSPTAASKLAKPIPEILVYSPGPMPCRCGRYLSEDFDSRLFCRGCEDPDSADITARLPLRHRPQ
jgi:hypothetical protein